MILICTHKAKVRTPPSRRYGLGDLHDANRWNNDNGLAVLLDFDNFSGDEDVPDDIRRLSAWCVVQDRAPCMHLGVFPRV